MTDSHTCCIKCCLPLMCMPCTCNANASGFFDVHKLTLCSHTEHAFPTMLHIPPGKGYRHVCPKCGQVSVAYGKDVTL